MAEMGQYPLLSEEEEIALAEQHQRGKAAKARLSETAVPDPQEREALEASVQRGAQERQRMARCNLRLVISVAKHYSGRGLPFEDLVQEGNVGLIEAIERYDPRRGNRFSTYAVWWIKQSVSRAIGNQARIVRLPAYVNTELHQLRRVGNELESSLQRRPTKQEMAEGMGVSLKKVRRLLQWQQNVLSLNAPVGDEGDSELADLLQDEDAPPVEETFAQRQLRESVHDVIAAQLSPREQQVLRLRFGFDDGQARTLAQVAEKLGVTRERVRQIQGRALRRLRHASIRHRELREAWA
jgi:RNA polymerase primary sigma factor